MTVFLAASGDGLETMWRLELLHPAVAHFPIVSIVLGAVFWLIGGLSWRWKRLDAFTLCGIVLIVISAVSAWAATQTGFWADERVGRDLYDPRPLKDHENLALTFSWIATALVGGAAVWRYAKLPELWSRLLWWATTAGLLTACGFIAYVAHLGASLVYQQGAGVIAPE